MFALDSACQPLQSLVTTDDEGCWDEELERLSTELGRQNAELSARREKLEAAIAALAKQADNAGVRVIGVLRACELRPTFTPCALTP